MFIFGQNPLSTKYIVLLIFKTKNKTKKILIFGNFKF